MKYSYSTNNESFFGSFESIEAAVAEAKSYGVPFRIGENVPPTPPENWWDANDWIEHVACQDEYSGDYADDWGHCSKQARDDLELQVRPILAAWLDKYNMRPTHFTVANVREYNADGTLIEAAAK